MERKIIISITLICFVICVQRCTSKYTVLPEHLEEKPVHSKVTVETLEGEVYYFDIVFVRDGYLEGYVDDSVLVSVELEDIESVRVLRYNPVRTAVLTLGILAVLGLAVLTWYAVALAEAMSHD